MVHVKFTNVHASCSPFNVVPLAQASGTHTQLLASKSFLAAPAYRYSCEIQMRGPILTGSLNLA